MTDNSNSKTTLEDLAKLAGVSISTVSRALNDQPLISTRTKQRIWALAREHGYAFRQSMPTAPIGAEGSIAIVTPNMRGRPLPLSHPFFLELLASIGEAARDRGYDFTVSHLAPPDALAKTVDALMHLGHEFVEMRAALMHHGRLLEEQIHQHGLAAADLAMDVEAVRRLVLVAAVEQAPEQALLALRLVVRKPQVERRIGLGDFGLRGIGLDRAGSDLGLVRFAK